MKHRDDVDTPAVALIGFIFAIVLFVIIVGILAWFRHQETKELMAKVVGPRNEKLAQVTTKQLEAISGYRLVDAERGVAAVPIDLAMKLAVRDIATSASLSKEGVRHETRNDG